MTSRCLSLETWTYLFYFSHLVHGAFAVVVVVASWPFVHEVDDLCSHTTRGDLQANLGKATTTITYALFTARAVQFGQRHLNRRLMGRTFQSIDWRRGRPGVAEAETPVKRRKLAGGGSPGGFYVDPCGPSTIGKQCPAKRLMKGHLLHSLHYTY